MSRPKLPSEMHPDFPKGWTDDTTKPVPTYHRPSREAYQEFYKAHPEFDSEGEYEFVCPYCGNQMSDDDWRGCCGEAGHGEWVLYGQDGEVVE